MAPMAMISIAGRLLRNVVKSGIRSVGYEMLRADRVPIQTLNLLYLACQALHSEKDNIVFVQIGANDGITRDPLRDLIIRFGLSGVLVEPVPRVFSILKKNYEGVAGLKFENAAIAGEDGERILYVPAKGAAGLGSQIATFDKEHLLRHGVKEEQIKPTPVKTLTLTTLLDKYHIGDLNLLQIDTEGYDFEIVQMAFDAGVRPDIIHFENCHLSPADKLRARECLSAEGYRYSETVWDTLAVSTSLL